MNEEEAIKNVKEQLEGIKKANECGLATKGEFNKDIEAITTILNLIQKQQKELNKEKEKNKQSKMRIVQLENEITARIEDVNKNFISKDKIKEKIEELKEEYELLLEHQRGRESKTTIKLQHKIEMCEELLEERID